MQATTWASPFQWTGVCVSNQSILLGRGIPNQPNLALGGGGWGH